MLVFISCVFIFHVKAERLKVESSMEVQENISLVLRPLSSLADAISATTASNLFIDGYTPLEKK